MMENGRQRSLHTKTETEFVSHVEYRIHVFPKVWAIIIIVVEVWGI